MKAPGDDSSAGRTTGTGVTGQENFFPYSQGLSSPLLLILLCQYWLLPATHFTSHQGQGSSEKVSLPTADWPGQLHSATGSHWASWRTGCDTHRSEHPLCGGRRKQQSMQLTKSNRNKLSSPAATNESKTEMFIKWLLIILGPDWNCAKIEDQEKKKSAAKSSVLAEIQRELN